MIALLLGWIGQGTLPHTFVYEASGHLQSVHVAGTFNNWTIGPDPMVLEQGTLKWKLTKNLAPGQHQYKFVLNSNEWITDPKAEKNLDDGNGNINSLLNLTTAEMRKPASRTDIGITASGLEHRVEPPYYAFDRGKALLKLRARKGDLARATVVIGEKSIPLAISDADEFHEWFSTSIPWAEKKPMAYRFEIVSGSRRTSFGAEGLDKKSNFEIGAGQNRPADVPSWPEQSVTYQIFPDRFENGDRSNDPTDVVGWDAAPTYSNFFGGDVAGIRKRIPYLKSLGIKAIYFNPIFKSPANHGYETTDYHVIEPRFGTNEEFGDMTRDLRKNGIRTVLDGVFNHTATNFGPFADIVKNGQASSFKDWFFIKSYPVKVGDPPNYEAWFGFPSLPKVNTANQAAFDYMQGVPAFWDTRADIAGWRLDVGNEIPMPFWREFRKNVKKLGQDRWIVGEVWGDGSGWLNKGDQWDSVMGYQFRDAVLKFIATGSMKPSEYFRQLMRVNDSYAPGVSRNLMILLGSHDTPRILTLCKSDLDRAKMAATLQLTWIGAPSIYYGDELGMEGDRDPENRRGMTWNTATDSNPMLKHYRALIAARNTSRALQSGEAKLLLADDANGVLAYSRTMGSEAAVTVINRSDRPRTVNLKVPAGTYRNIFDEKPLPSPNGIAKVTLGPKSSAVYRTLPKR